MRPATYRLLAFVSMSIFNPVFPLHQKSLFYLIFIRDVILLIKGFSCASYFPRMDCCENWCAISGAFTAGVSHPDSTLMTLFIGRELMNH